MTARLIGMTGALAILGLLGLGPAHAAQITVLCGQGDVSGLRALAPAFEKATGHTVVLVEAGDAQSQRIDNGPADVVTAGPDAIEALVRQGKVVAGTATKFGQAGVGVAVKSGAPPPISRRPKPTGGRCWRPSRSPIRAAAAARSLRKRSQSWGSPISSKRRRS